MSPFERHTAAQGALLVVDVQEKLVNLLPHRDLLVANVVRLIDGAKALEIPTFATEQYPQGLGPSVPEVVERLPHRPAKTTFHCCSVAGIQEQFSGRRIHHVTVCGIEAHVCVAQTALELLRMGLAVQVPADAVASRGKMDWQFALRRLERAGATVSTTEAILFEWVECSDHPQFKTISNLIKSFVPPPKKKHKETR
jgi:nicotinamidase-related amidase